MYACLKDTELRAGKCEQMKHYCTSLMSLRYIHVIICNRHGKIEFYKPNYQLLQTWVKKGETNFKGGLTKFLNDIINQCVTSISTVSYRSS